MDSFIQYTILPQIEGSWQVKRDGATRASASNLTLNQAIRKGKELCKRQHGCLMMPDVQNLHARGESSSTRGGNGALPIFTPPVYRVMPHPCGDWQVKKDGTSRASAAGLTRKQALRKAKELAARYDGVWMITDAPTSNAF